MVGPLLAEASMGLYLWINDPRHHKPVNASHGGPLGESGVDDHNVHDPPVRWRGHRLREEGVEVV